MSVHCERCWPVSFLVHIAERQRDVPYMSQLDGLSALVKKHAAHWRSVEPSSAMIVDERQFGRQARHEGGWTSEGSEREEKE